jgi:hypothetical protein
MAPLSLYSQDHYARSREPLKQALSQICRAPFHPLQVLEVIPKVLHTHNLSLPLSSNHPPARSFPLSALTAAAQIMNTMVVEFMSGSRFASIKALEGYSQVHRLLLEFVREFLELRETCNAVVRNFIAEERYRCKDVVPDLGEFLALLTGELLVYCISEER